MSGKNQKEFQKLVQKYLDGTASSEEQNILDHYYLLFRDEPANTSLLNKEQLSLLEERLERGLFERIRQPAKVSKMWPRIAIVAAVATIVFGVGLFVYKNQQKTGATVTAYVNDIAPGKVGATLTLGSGRQIRLSDAANGEIAREAGIIVTKTAEGQLVYEIKETTGDPNKINTLTTAKGETYVLTLPDKSMVWMNAASSLTYTAALLEHGVRRVKLEGEAYFQVSKDKVHPFVVESKGQNIEVLGTHFNVNAYPDEPVIKTTLLEGSVKVLAYPRSGDAATTIRELKPNQQSVLSGSKIIVNEVVAEYAVAWKNGCFMFNSETLEGVMNRVSKWYNITVEYDDDEVRKKTMLGSVSRGENLSKVIRVLQRTGVATFKMEGNKIKISKN